MDLMRNGGFRRLDDPEPSSRLAPTTFITPQLFSACKAVTLRDVGNAEVSDPNKVIMKFQINWGHASATQIKRVLVDAGGGAQSLIQRVDEVVSQRDTRKAFEKAPHIPISGSSWVSMSNERLQIGSAFSGSALRVMDVFSKYSILTRVRRKNPQEVWNAFLSSWAGVSGAPKS